ncbi:MAG: hypothetical protein DRQ06_03810, partial [Candidatus Hydrothermota bacterium]
CRGQEHQIPERGEPDQEDPFAFAHGDIIDHRVVANKFLDGVGSCNLHDPTPQNSMIARFLLNLSMCA